MESQEAGAGPHFFASEFFSDFPPLKPRSILWSGVSYNPKNTVDVENGGTLLLWVPCLGELLAQPALKSQPESGGHVARAQAGEKIVPFSAILTLCLTPGPHMRLQILA